MEAAEKTEPIEPAPIEEVGEAALVNGNAESVPKEPEPAEVEERAGMSGLKALDRWHRSMPEERGDVLSRCSGQAATALREFAGLLEGKHAAYRSALRIELPQDLGDEFARYAESFAEGGVAQLATSLRPQPNPSPAWMAWSEALATVATDQQEDRVGGPALGRTVKAMLNMGYDRERVLAMRPAAESLGRRAGASMPFDEYKVLPGESLYHIRAKYRKQERMLNYRWIADFNDRSSYNLREGELIKIPKQELHIEVWREARVVVVFAGDRPIRIYPASVGRKGEETPLGSFTIDICEKEPVYYGVSPAVPYGSPDNPLGDRWLGFEEKPSYGLHGTNSEETIGTWETEGCVRMHNADVIDLFDLVPTGTAVTIHS